MNRVLHSIFNAADRLGCTILFFMAILLSDSYAGEWHVNFSASHRRDLKMSLDGGGYSQASDVSSYLAGLDDITAFADRTFDDGYVHIDSATLNAGAHGYGDTWNWGYDDAAQYDAGAKTLTFLRQVSASGSSTVPDTRVHEDHFTAWDLEWSAGRGWIERGRFTLDMEIGLGGFLDAEASARQESTSVWGSYTGTYVYPDVHNILSGVPPGHTGDYNGPGPLISELPGSRTITLGSGSGVLSYNRITGDLELDRLRLFMGSKFNWTLTENSSLYFYPRVSLNYMHAEIIRKEDLLIQTGGSYEVIQSWRDEESESSWIPALSIQVGYEQKLSERWFMRSGLEVEWFEDDFGLGVGPSRVTLDLDHFSISSAIGLSF